MRFTVLGADGFIGSHLAAYLRSAGHEVLVAGRDAPFLFEEPLGHVIYCIGLTADFRARPFDTVRAHVSVLAEVLERADFSSMLYLSSTRVYSGVAVATEAARLSVDSTDPSDLYNLSKLMGESVCLNCGRPNARVARLSNVVGYDPVSRNFLATLIGEALAGQICLHSDPSSTKDYILLDDVVALLSKIALTGKRQIYNVASGVNLGHGQVAGLLAELTGCSVSVAENVLAHVFPPIDVTRIMTEFSFVPSAVPPVIPGLVEQYRARMIASESAGA